MINSLIEKARRESSMIFVLVLLSLYLGNALMAVFITPLTHIGGPEQMPLHLAMAIAGSAILILGPILLLWSHPLSALARHAAAIAMGLECSLATALSGGQIELHFTFFIAMVFLSLALDPLILWTFVFVVFIDHAIRGWFIPDSVYGCSMWQSKGSGARPPLWLAAEHAGFVAIQLVALMILIKKRTQELIQTYLSKAELDKLEGTKIEKVAERINQDLIASVLEAEQATIATELLATETKTAATKVAMAIKIAKEKLL